MKAIVVTGALVFAGFLVVAALGGCSEASKRWSSTDLDQPAVQYRQGPVRLQEGGV